MTFSSHDPLKHKLDLNFFELAETEFGMVVTKVAEEQRVSYPFTENDGMDVQRGVVYTYTLRIA